MRKPRASAVFVYSMSVAVAAFIVQSPVQAAVLAAVNGVVGLVLGGRKFILVVALLLVGLIGLFTNILVFSNTGPPVLETPLFTLRKQGLVNLVRVASKLLAFMGAGLILASLTTPRELVESLETELRLPQTIVFPLAVALRMVKLVQKDAAEIGYMRMQRGLRRTPVTPEDIAGYLRPLISLGLERATWIGIAAELRGFSSRKPRRREISLGLPEALLAALLAVQIALIIVVQY